MIQPQRSILRQRIAKQRGKLTIDFHDFLLLKIRQGHRLEGLFQECPIARLAGAQGFLKSAQQFLPAGATQGMNDLPAWGAYIFNFLGVLFNVGFGALGGWVGAAIFDPNRKSKTE